MKQRFSKGERGQTSIEIALVTGVFFLIVISAFPYFTEVNTMNKGVSAARDGATFAQSMLNMGYASEGVSLPKGAEVRLDAISYTEETTNSTKTVNILLTISGTADDDVATQIKNQAGNYIFYSFNSNWNTSTNGTVVAGDYIFIVSYALV